MVRGGHNRPVVTQVVDHIIQFPVMLIVSQDNEKIDGISGATYSFNRFALVDKKALADARAK